MFDFVKNFNFPVPGNYWDIFLIAIFMAAAFIYGYAIGKNRILLLIISTYLSAVLIEFVIWDIPGDTRGYIFLALTALFFFALPHSAFSSALKIKKKGRGTIWQILFFSIAQLGLLAAFLFYYLPESYLAEFSPLIRKVFSLNDWGFGWMIAPLILACIFKRGLKKEEK